MHLHIQGLNGGTTAASGLNILAPK